MSRTADRSEGPWIDPREAGTRLILAPPSGTPASLIELSLGERVVAALLLPPALADADAARLLARCIGDGKAGLTRDVDQAARLQASGVHLDAARTVEAARARLGRDAIIGVSCGLSRHDAMIAGEAGADYLLLGAPGGEPAALVEMVEWWIELFVLPCAAACSSGSAVLPELLDAEIDFIWVDDAAWSDASGPGAEIAAISRMIAAARR